MTSSRPKWASRQAALALLAALWIGCWSLPLARPAYAQDAPAAVQANAENPNDAPESKSRVQWFLESSGWIGAGILLLSIYFVATVVRLLVELRTPVAIPPQVLQQCEAMAANQDFRGIFNVASADNSLFSTLMVTGLNELSEGVTKAREAMERMDDFKTAELEKRISMLAVLGTLGPMIGLLGTLKGMIASFSVIAMSDTQLRASEVAAGISQALLLTFEGVSLSVPAIYFYAFFRNRVMLITSEALLKADELVRRIAKNVRNRPSPPPLQRQ